MIQMCLVNYRSPTCKRVGSLASGKEEKWCTPMRAWILAAGYKVVKLSLVVFDTEAGFTK